uniref:Uncharacterized protein n=1 Tax=Rhizophora mucronata TaxID=61149 RepID=A0A2P2Q5X3_RHIMU
MQSVALSFCYGKIVSEDRSWRFEVLSLAKTSTCEAHR